MFVNHAHAVSANGPSPLSLPFVPLRNVSPHSTIVVLFFGGGAPAAPTAAADCVRFVRSVAAAATVAAVADEADAAAAVAAGRC